MTQIIFPNIVSGFNPDDSLRFDPKSPTSPEPECDLSAGGSGVRAKENELEAKVRAAEVYKQSEAIEKLPSEGEFYRFLGQNYFAFYQSCRWGCVPAALKAFEDSKVRDWKSINEADFKAIMSASEWSNIFKDPKTIEKLFRVMLGNADVNRKTINIYELAFIFIWLGSPKEIAGTFNFFLDPEEAIRVCHFIFIKSMEDRLDLKFKFAGIAPNYTDTGKNRLSKLQLNCFRNVVFHNSIIDSDNHFLVIKQSDDINKVTSSILLDIEIDNDDWDIFDQEEQTQINLCYFIMESLKQSYCSFPEAPPPPFPKF